MSISPLDLFMSFNRVFYRKVCSRVKDQYAKRTSKMNQSKRPLQSINFRSAILTNLWFFHYCSILLSLPVEVDVSQHRLSRSTSWFKRLRWNLFLLLMVVKCIYCISTYCVAFAVRSIYNPLHGPFHLVLAVDYVVASSAGYLYFTRHPNTFIILWNTLLADRFLVEKQSVQQVFLYVFPWTLTGLVVAAFLLVATDPTWVSQFRYVVYLLGEQGYLGGNWYLMATAMALALDCVTFGFITGVASIMIATHLVAMEVWICVVQGLAQVLKSNYKVPMAIADFTYQKLRRLQLTIRYFNVSNAGTIFLVKLACISISSIGFSVAILSEGNALALFSTVYNSVIALFTYPVVYQKAYKVPEGIKSARRAVMEKGTRSISVVEMAHVRRKFEAVSATGIMVGGFKTFERESIPVFVDFVANTLNSILLAKR